MTYDFHRLSDLVEVLGSFHGPINVRADMRRACREKDVDLAQATVSVRVRIVMTEEVGDG